KIVPWLGYDYAKEADEDNLTELAEVDYIAQDESCPSYDKQNWRPQTRFTSTDDSLTSAAENYGNLNYVRKADVVAFESQRTCGGKKIYWLASFNFEENWDSEMYLKSVASFTQAEGGWTLQPFSECDMERETENARRVENADKNATETFRCNSNDSSDNCQSSFLMGHAYLYGLRGLDINTAAAASYLTKAADNNNSMAKYELGKL
ncbi:hypothetical protein DFQ29_003296, partial [Apophysomyces sp. BC1021]